MTDDTQAKVAETVARLRRRSSAPDTIIQSWRDDLSLAAELLEALARDMAAANGVWQANLALIADRDRLARELAAARDPAVLAADPLVQAMIGAAYKAGEALARDIAKNWESVPDCYEYAGPGRYIASAIRGLTPADAMAALARALQAERAKALDQAKRLVREMTDCGADAMKLHDAIDALK